VSRHREQNHRPSVRRFWETTAYNILRSIGQWGLLGEKTPVRHPARRRRIKTVMQELMYLAARLVKTGRRLKLLFGRHCPAFGAFEGVYARLACG
jgi:hypothetical protein